MPSPAAKAIQFLIVMGLVCPYLACPCLVCLCHAAQPPATTQSSEESDVADLVNETQHIYAQWQELPLLNPCSINQVVRFNECQGLLVTDWPILSSSAVQQELKVLAPNANQAHPVANAGESIRGRIPLTDLPGRSILGCFFGRHSTAPMFDYYDLKMPQAVRRHLQVLSGPLHLQVVQDLENARSGRTETISLIQNLETNDSDPITLRVQARSGDQPTQDVVVSAPTLPELRRKHPYEFEKYLRPLFQQFRQDQSVFAVEDRVAWQVMAAQWRRPADIAAQIDPLISQLNSPVYSQRQQAQLSLEKLGEPAALYLHTADHSQWTAEQKSRVNELLSQFFPLNPQQADQLGRDVNFLLDCLASDDPILRAATIDHLEYLLGHKIDVNLDQPPLQRLGAITLLRRQLMPKSPKDDLEN